MAILPKKLKQKLEKRQSDNALRALSDTQPLIDFSSNDYLGLARKEELVAEATNLLKEKKMISFGSTGSRLLTGNHILFKELEHFLADFHNSESAVVFNSGYDGNLGFFSSVPQRGDIIFFDELVHASIRDGIQMSNANSYKFYHNDLNDLRNCVERNQKREGDSEVYIVTESVFSMDGDSPDLELLAEFCQENNFHLIVDEAHAVGVFGKGRGLVSQLDLEKKVFARVVTFGKALGNHGAAILCSEQLKIYLLNFARSLIYTTALSPHSVASTLAAYRYLEQSSNKESSSLMTNIAFFKEKIVQLGFGESFIKSQSTIHCMLAPGNKKVKQLSRQLKKAGFDVRPILSPTVKVGEERLRFCLHSYNTKEEIKNIFQTLRAYI